MAAEVPYPAPTLHVEDGHEVVAASSGQGLPSPIKRERRHFGASNVALPALVEIDLHN